MGQVLRSLYSEKQLHLLNTNYVLGPKGFYVKPK